MTDPAFDPLTPKERARFAESINVSVTLSAAGTSTSLSGGNVKGLSLDLACYGFTGSVRLWVVAQKGEDELFPIVTQDEPLSIEVSVLKALYNIKPIPEALKLSGLVRRQSLREVPSADIGGNPILYREYTLEFSDAARALWSQHRPSQVYAKSTLEKVITEHTPALVSVKSNWTRAKQTRGIIALGLGEDDASFYDFLFWIAEREHGHLWYDYSTQTFVVDNAKPNAGSAVEFVPGALANSQSIQIHLAPRRRHAVRLLNSRDGATPITQVEQPNALAGVSRDRLLHTALDVDVQARKGIEEARNAAGRYDVTLNCGAYPEMYLAPGVLTKVGTEFGDKLFATDETLRVLRVSIDAEATNQIPEYDIENDTTEYGMSFCVELEPADDTRFRGYAFRAPRYPFEVEAKVLSAVGAKGDRAYTVVEGDDASNTYKVEFPLWNSTVIIPVTPDFMPGHLYFPVYKDSRVFMSVGFESARIARFLDWGTEVAMSNASQGNHLLLGKNATSETSIKHWYSENSPELIIERTHDADFATLVVKEGTMTLELTEKGGGASASGSVSVEPQAQMTQAQVEQQSEAAVSDLTASGDAASAKVNGSVQQATSAVQQRASTLDSDVKKSTSTIDDALRKLGDGIDEQIQKVESIATDAEQELEKLLKG